MSYAVCDRDPESGELVLKASYSTRAKAKEALEVLEAQAWVFDELGYSLRTGDDFEFRIKKVTPRQLAKLYVDKTDFYDLISDTDAFDKAVAEELGIDVQEYEELLTELGL